MILLVWNLFSYGETVSNSIKGPRVTVFVDWQEGFDRDNIRAFVEGQKIFDCQISSEHMLGLARGFSFSVTKSEFNMSVEDNGKCIPFVIDLKNGNHLGFEKKRDDLLILRQSKFAFFYD
jgi:hypothetical protein